MKPIYRYAKLSEPCQCGSGQPYRACCFRSDLIGLVVALAVVAALLFLPAESWWYRVVRGGSGLLTWFCIFAMLREWFVRRRTRKKEDKHVV